MISYYKCYMKYYVIVFMLLGNELLAFLNVNLTKN